jgi:hypothetical protein
MSSILNALRKVEEDRSPGHAGPLREHVAVAPRRRSTLWAWSAGALVGILFAGAVLFLTRSLWAGHPLAPAEKAAASTSPVAASVVETRPERRTTSAPRPPVRRLDAAPPAPPKGVPIPPPEAEAAPIASAPPPAVPEEVVKESPGFAPGREAAAEVEERLPAPMVVAQIVWHPRPELRRAWLLVDGEGQRREVKEGDRIGHYIVRRIEPGAVLFESGSIELRKMLGARG